MSNLEKELAREKEALARGLERVEMLERVWGSTNRLAEAKNEAKNEEAAGKQAVEVGDEYEASEESDDEMPSELFVDSGEVTVNLNIGGEAHAAGTKRRQQAGGGGAKRVKFEASESAQEKRRDEAGSAAGSAAETEAVKKAENEADDCLSGEETNVGDLLLESMKSELVELRKFKASALKVKAEEDSRMPSGVTIKKNGKYETRMPERAKLNRMKIQPQDSVYLAVHRQQQVIAGLKQVGKLHAAYPCMFLKPSPEIMREMPQILARIEESEAESKRVQTCEQRDQDAGEELEESEKSENKQESVHAGDGAAGV